ncbi:MAG: hypothetical protein IPP95_00005 [Flavobacteriales bacterium]|nr:MAG: hypothetical protein IPP95_00005 [Flavobacteriales bacterium]
MTAGKAPNPPALWKASLKAPGTRASGRAMSDEEMRYHEGLSINNNFPD